MELKLPYPSAYPRDLLPLLRKAFEELYREGLLFRQVGVILKDLTSKQRLQLGLFEKNKGTKDLKAFIKLLMRLT